MRLKFTTACIIGVTGVVLGFTIARAQAPKTPSTEELRKAVASLRGGRIPRPTSYDAMTADQKAFVTSVLSGVPPASLLMRADHIDADGARCSIPMYSRHTSTS